MTGGYKNNIRRLKRGGYEYKVTVNGKQYHGACDDCTNRQQALAFVANLKADLSKNVVSSSSSVINTTIADLGVRYELYTKSRSGDLKHVKSKVRFFNNYFGEDKLASSIKRSDIDVLVNDLTSKGFKSTTIDRYISALSKMYNLAIEDDIDLKNPCAKRKKLGLYDQNTFKYWKQEEITQIRKIAPDWLKDMIDFALITALRRANIRLFKKDWINWDCRILTIPREHSKSKKAITLPIAGRLESILLRNLENNNTEYIFINRTRKAPFSEKRMETTLKECCKLAGVAYYGWHGFRHTAGTRMANAGVAIHEIQSFMGHSTPLVTRKYLDNDFDNKLKAMEILEKIDENEQVHD